MPLAQPVAAQAPAPLPADPASVEVTVSHLSDEIARKTEQGTSRFDVQLTPDGLGRVDVAVEIDGRGRVTAALSFEKAGSAALVKDRSDDLQAALNAAGLTIAPEDLRISHQTAGDAQAAVAAQAANPSAAGAPQTPDPKPQPSPGWASSHNGFQQGQQGQNSQGHNPQGHNPQGQGGGHPGARSFADAAGAADVIDRQTAWRATLAPRGLDIRI